MHLRPEAIRWTQDEEFVRRMTEPRPLTVGQWLLGIILTLTAAALIFFATSDGLEAKRGQEPVLLTNNLSYCYFWDGAKLVMSRSPSSECQAP